MSGETVASFTLYRIGFCADKTSLRCTVYCDILEEQKPVRLVTYHCQRRCVSRSIWYEKCAAKIVPSVNRTSIRHNFHSCLAYCKRRISETVAFERQIYYSL